MDTKYDSRKTSVSMLEFAAAEIYKIKCRPGRKSTPAGEKSETIFENCGKQERQGADEAEKTN